MKSLSLCSSAALILSLSCGAAFAVTPEEVWSNWQAAAAASGQQITAGSESRTATGIDLTDVKIVTAMPDSGIVITTMIPKVALADPGDGTVTIGLSESYSMTIGESGTRPSPAGVTFAIALPDARISASGEATAVRYTYALPTLTGTLTKATDVHDRPLDATFDVRITGIEGTQLIAPQANGSTTFDATVSVDRIEATGAAANPADAETYKATFSAVDLDSMSKGQILPADMMADFAMALTAGFSTETRTTGGAMSASFEFTDRRGANTWQGELSEHHSSVMMDKTRVDFGFGMKSGKLAVNMPSEGLPPMDGSFTEITLHLAGPLAKTDAPQDFVALLRLVDVAASDMVWAMAGPAAGLPHDPMTAIVDLKGKMGWAFDLFDEAAGGMTEVPEMPVLLYSADLTQFLLKFVGAEAAATGALTFDNTDLATWDGLPAPTGTISANMKGVNELLDRLVQMGLLPQDQLMSARMMLAMFAKPGPGPGELVSEVEFKDKGLFVNGQKIR